MAQWDEINGVVVPEGTSGAVHHDTDNLAYGDQGDTRYWDGKPGDVGSVTYDRPKDEAGAQQQYVVVDSNTPGSPPIVKSVGGSGSLMALLSSGPVSLATWKEIAVKQAGQVKQETVKQLTTTVNSIGSEAGAELGLPPETVAKVTSWIKSNPIWAGLIGLVGMELVFGDGGSHRRRR